MIPAVSLGPRIDISARVEGAPSVHIKTHYKRSEPVLDPTVWPSQRLLLTQSGETLFSQGEPAHSVFYIKQGRAKLTVLSAGGKEATLMLLSAGDFAGEEALTTVLGLHLATATAITALESVEITGPMMARCLSDSHRCSDLFLAFLLRRNLHVQDNLIDHLFNCSEKRLARTLLLMAESASGGDPDALLPSVTQEALAEMIGTTRSRVNFFMNRFRKLGFIEYRGRIRVNKVRLSSILRE